MDPTGLYASIGAYEGEGDDKRQRNEFRDTNREKAVERMYEASERMERRGDREEANYVKATANQKAETLASEITARKQEELEAARLGEPSFNGNKTLAEIAKKLVE